MMDVKKVCQIWRGAAKHKFGEDNYPQSLRGYVPVLY